MPLTISVPDSLRMSVEAATGGLVTVLYTSNGLPGYYRVIPKFNKQDIDASLGTGVHEAFIVNGVEKSEIFVGQFQAKVSNGVALSLPGQDPTTGINFDTARANCAANGPGFHLMTNAEWAAVALWCWKNGFQPRGNTYYGRSSDATFETGRRVDGLPIGDTGGTARTLTGSGPASWRHDNSPAGIADLSGNVWEWVGGMRINAGEINVISNNDAANNAADQSAGSALWKAIDAATGALVVPGTAGATLYGTSGAANNTLVRGSGASFEGMANPGGTPVGATALALAKSLGLYPVASSGLGSDVFYIDLTSERLPIRGGSWNNGASAGVFALALIYARSGAYGNIGFRPAFVA